jgi:hypothetical protein
MTKKVIDINSLVDNCTLYGYCIAVIDKGFVYVGNCYHDMTTNMLYIPDARNIRNWGTTGGLHELVNTGPTDNSVIDGAAYVLFPWHSVISLHITDQKHWKFKDAVKAKSKK